MKVLISKPSTYGDQDSNGTRKPNMERSWLPRHQADLPGLSFGSKLWDRWFLRPLKTWICISQFWLHVGSIWGPFGFQSNEHMEFHFLNRIYQHGRRATGVLDPQNQPVCFELLGFIGPSAHRRVRSSEPAFASLSF
jgi:hypothetical protein